uniref:Uncharacterized protein TCIL3000_10_2920 n=1 Tax=Trypanosoma congolense (strain IL3000) TaxID=1068625 RepID=G0UVW5_TRYCI|nr:unnamed protein product [Trypanosoma congolense IL3000]
MLESFFFSLPESLPCMVLLRCMVLIISYICPGSSEVDRCANEKRCKAEKEVRDKGNKSGENPRTSPEIEKWTEQPFLLTRTSAVININDGLSFLFTPPQQHTTSHAYTLSKSVSIDFFLFLSEAVIANSTDKVCASIPGDTRCSCMKQLGLEGISMRFWCTSAQIKTPPLASFLYPHLCARWGSPTFCGLSPRIISLSPLYFTFVSSTNHLPRKQYGT